MPRFFAVDLGALFVQDCTNAGSLNFSKVGRIVRFGVMVSLTATRN
jgi:hypothetical protein